MSDFSDTTFEQLPLSAKRRIDAICARFEQAWREGRPRVEPFVSEASGEEREVLLAELLYIDIECRKKAGEEPHEGDYLKQFPGEETVVRLVLDSSSRVNTIDRTEGGGATPIVHKLVGEVPGYQVLGELGRGGMGVVYKARQLALERLVALKFVLAGRNAPTRLRERFRREAELIARLRHPNIVQIYDFGEVEGQWFLALEYAEGGSLRERLTGSVLEPRAAATILEPIARAVQHAHRQGVIHRDIKPANILLSVGGDSVALGNLPLPEYRQGAFDVPSLPESQTPLTACTPKLTDFGLARMLDHEGSGSELGVAAGTPQYMAPEQASGAPECGPACDVWAMGVTLYELLTGRPPFRAASPRETLRLILEADPVPPRQIQPSVPRNLETICLKCLEKKPERRYAGARELAVDLRCFLDGKPIQARPLGWMGRLRERGKRHPWLAGGLAVLVAALLAGVAYGVLGVLEAIRGRWVAERCEREARAGLDLEAEKARLARLDQQRAEASLAEADRRATGLLQELAMGHGEFGQIDRAVHDLLAGFPLARGAPEVERPMRTALAAWLPHVQPLEAILQTPEETLCLLLMGDGTVITGARSGIVRTHRGGHRPASPSFSLEMPIRLLATQPSERFLLVAEGGALRTGPSHRVRLRDRQINREIGCTPLVPGFLSAICLAPDGQSFYTATLEGVVRQYDATGKEKAPLLEYPMPVHCLALSPEGSRIAVGLGEPGAVWVHTRNGGSITTRKWAHPGPVTTLAFHPDGGRLFTGGTDGKVRLLDLDTGSMSSLDLRPGGALLHLEPTPDGLTLLTVTTEQVARLWDVQLGRILGEFFSGSAFARFSFQGDRIAIANTGEVRVRSLARPLQRLPARPAPGLGGPPIVSSWAWLPQSRQVLTGEAVSGRASGLAWVQSLNETTPPQAPWRHLFPAVTRVAVDREGKLAATVCRKDDQCAVTVWDLATGVQRLGPIVLPVVVEALALSPAGDEVAVGDNRGVLRRWNTRTRTRAGDAWLQDAGITALAYSPGGKGLAIGSGISGEGRGGVIWLDLASGQLEPWTIPHPSEILSLEFSADGARLLVGGRAVCLWRVDSRTALTRIVRNATVCRLAAGDRLVLVGTADGHTHQLGASGEDEERKPVRHPAPVTAVDLSPDGGMLLVGGQDGSVRRWNVGGDPRLIGPAIFVGQRVAEARLLDRHGAFFTLTEDDHVRRWQGIQPLEGPLGDLERLVCVRTGKQADVSGSLTRLSEDIWAARRSRLEATSAHNRDIAPWHEARALDALEGGLPFAALFHLDALVRLAPSNRTYLRRRADALVALHRFGPALADYRAAAGKDDGFVELEAGLARAQIRADGKAVRWYLDQMARLRPDTPWLESERAAWLTREAERSPRE